MCVHTIKDEVQVYSVNGGRAEVLVYNNSTARHEKQAGDILFMEVAFTPGGVYWWHRYGVLLDIDRARGYAATADNCRYYTDTDIYDVPHLISEHNLQA